MKRGHIATFDRVAELISQHHEWPISDFFGQDVVLSPVPGSAATRHSDLWVPKLICEKFLERGLGQSIYLGLQRTAAVPKSAFAAPGERPTVSQHYQSMHVESGLFRPERITLVDDVITRGRTSFAAAWRVHETYPNADIRVFAIIRTQGFLADIQVVRDPSIGLIRLNANGSDVNRSP